MCNRACGRRDRAGHPVWRFPQPLHGEHAGQWLPQVLRPDLQMSWWHRGLSDTVRDLWEDFCCLCVSFCWFGLWVCLCLFSVCVCVCVDAVSVCVCMCVLMRCVCARTHKRTHVWGCVCACSFFLSFIYICVFQNLICPRNNLHTVQEDKMSAFRQMSDMALFNENLSLLLEKQQRDHFIVWHGPVQWKSLSAIGEATERSFYSLTWPCSMKIFICYWRSNREIIL